MEPGPRSGSRAKLSCVRCKQKKIRCNKADPQCDKCSTSGVQCAYVQRRQRTRRTPQQRDTIGRLSRQLESLGAHVSTLGPTLSQTSAESSATADDRRTVADLNISSTKGNTPNQEPEANDHESGVFYRMANDARNTTINKLCDKELLTAESSPNVDSALAALNGALAALGDLSVGPHASPTLDPNDVLTREEERKCVDDAYESLSTILPAPPVDLNMLRAMPDIVNSPHIRVDPAASLMYYAFIFEGRSSGPKRSAAAAKHDYIKCLQSVPAWHKSATGTVMDMMVALTTAIVAITCFDYHLSWKFHCEACRFAEQLGLDDTDVSSPQITGSSFAKSDLQGAFWCLVQMDFLFKLFYNKPAVIKPSTTRRIVSSAHIPVSSRVKPGPTVVLILWTRIFFILTEFFNYIEGHNTEEDQRPEIFEQKIGSFCDQLEELVNDWSLESLLKPGDQDPMVKWLHADLTIGTHTMIILMERKLSDDGYLPVSPRSLRSGRTVLNAIIEFSGVDPGRSHHIFTFYPFCAFFALYYHILSCANPDECKGDIQLLEKVGRILERVKLLRSEFTPISNAVNALNHVSNAIQENRTRPAASNPAPASSLPTTEYPPSTQQGYTYGYDPMSGIDVPQVNFLDSTMDLPVDFGEGFQPMEYMRAIENEFAGRNWHESWWSVG